MGGAAAGEFEALDAADDEPDGHGDQDRDADDDGQGDDADGAVEQADPEGADLQAVVAPRPLRCLTLV